MVDCARIKGEGKCEVNFSTGKGNPCVWEEDVAFQYGSDRARQQIA